MPPYRIHIKLDGQDDVREFIIEDSRINIEYVYQEYKKRVNTKNGTGWVIYFDFIVIAEHALLTRMTGKRFLMQGIIMA